MELVIHLQDKEIILITFFIILFMFLLMLNKQYKLERKHKTEISYYNDRFKNQQEAYNELYVYAINLGDKYNEAMCVIEEFNLSNNKDKKTEDKNDDDTDSKFTV